MGFGICQDRIGSTALSGELGTGRRGKFRLQLNQSGNEGCSHLLPHRAGALGADGGEAHAIGGEEAGEGVQQHRGHAQRVGDEAGVLAAGATEAVQGIACHVIAALDGDLLDGVGHVLHGDGDEAVRHFLGRAAAADLGGQRRELLPHHLGIEGLVLGRAEDLREVVRDQLAQHHVGIGDGQRPAAAIAGGSGIGPGGIRADAEARAVVMQDGAAARRHRVDAHHGRADAHAGDLGVEGGLQLAVIVADIGGGAAHVEADDALEAGQRPGLRRAHHAAGRAGEQGILALEQVGGGEAARRHHEHQADGLGPAVALGAAGEFIRHLPHIAAQDGGEIGVGDRGVATPHQLDEG